MKELTIITTCEITDIIQVEDNFEMRNDAGMERIIKDELGADNAKILKKQISIRDLPDQIDHTETVGTPEETSFF